jgi:hypothetical protein
MSSNSLPVFDEGDVALSGWEFGLTSNGDLVIQTGPCGAHSALRLPPGASIIHHPDGRYEFTGVTFRGGKPFTGHLPSCVREG